MSSPNPTALPFCSSHGSGGLAKLAILALSCIMAFHSISVCNLPGQRGAETPRVALSRVVPESALRAETSAARGGGAQVCERVAPRGKPNSWTHHLQRGGCSWCPGACCIPASVWVAPWRWRECGAVLRICRDSFPAGGAGGAGGAPLPIPRESAFPFDPGGFDPGGRHNVATVAVLHLHRRLLTSLTARVGGGGGGKILCLKCKEHGHARERDAGLGLLRARLQNYTAARSRSSQTSLLPQHRFFALALAWLRLSASLAWSTARGPSLQHP